VLCLFDRGGCDSEQTGNAAVKEGGQGFLGGRPNGYYFRNKKFYFIDIATVENEKKGEILSAVRDEGCRGGKGNVPFFRRRSLIKRPFPAKREKQSTQAKVGQGRTEFLRRNEFLLGVLEHERAEMGGVYGREGEKRRLSIQYGWGRLYRDESLRSSRVRRGGGERSSRNRLKNRKKKPSSRYASGEKKCAAFSSEKDCERDGKSTIEEKASKGIETPPFHRRKRAPYLRKYNGSRNTLGGRGGGGSS